MVLGTCMLYVNFRRSLQPSQPASLCLPCESAKACFAMRTDGLARTRGSCDSKLYPNKSEGTEINSAQTSSSELLHSPHSTWVFLDCWRIFRRSARLQAAHWTSTASEHHDDHLRPTATQHRPCPKWACSIAQPARLLRKLPAAMGRSTCFHIHNRTLKSWLSELSGNDGAKRNPRSAGRARGRGRAMKV